MNKTTLIVMTLAATIASAQEKKKEEAAKPAEPAAMQPPKMTDEGKKYLEGWLGKWTSSDAVYSMGTMKMTGNMKMSCEKVSGGWGTLCKGVFNTKGMPPAEGTFLLAWDIATGEAHMFEVQNTAEVHDHAGKWKDDKSVSLVRTGKNLEGKDEKDDCTVTWNSPKELKMDCTGSVAGATVWTFALTAKK